MKRVVAMGEVLIDFIPSKKDCLLKEVESFFKKPGGAPANVAACVSRLGGNAKFIGQVGDDAFGDFLLDVLMEEEINVDHVYKTKDANTALAFVSLRADGERDFSFYRKPSADMLLSEEKIDESIFSCNDILHFCSVDLIEAPIKYAHIKAINLVKEIGGLISFDPNVRLPLWDNHEECRQTICDFIPYADILKISDDELLFITDQKDEESALKRINELNPQLTFLIITRGGEGVDAWYDGVHTCSPGFKVNVIDTTGAGDSFIGAFLFSLSQGVDLSMNEMLKFSNAVGALTTMREGAISALPTYDEVKQFIDPELPLVK